MGVVYLAYCGSWQLSLHVPCFCAFYIFNTTPNPTSSSFFQSACVCMRACMHVCVSVYMYVSLCVCLKFEVQDLGAVKT